MEKYGFENTSLFIRIAIPDYETANLEFLDKIKDLKVKNIKIVDSNTEATPEASRDMAVKEMFKLKADYIMLLDSYVQLTDPSVLNEAVSVIENNSKNGVRIIAPLVKQYKESWSNFWGALSDDGWYARSQDYLSIAHGEIDGLFNVPYANHVILLKESALSELYEKATDERAWSYGELDYDMAFCYRLREFGINIYILSKSQNYDKIEDEYSHYGRILVITEVKVDKLYPDLWQMATNPKDFELKYMNPILLTTLKAKN